MDFTHCWSLLHHSSLSLSISTSHGLLQSLHITLYVTISTSHEIPDSRKLTMFESSPPRDFCTVFRSYKCLNIHHLQTPVKCPEGFIYWIYTWNDVIWTIFYLHFSWTTILHLPWTSTISPFNSVCYNLRLSWTTRLQKFVYVCIFTSLGLLYTVKKLCMFESPPPVDYHTLSRWFYILNLHLKWPPMDYTHCWSLLHHSSLPLSISTSHGLLQYSI